MHRHTIVEGHIEKRHGHIIVDRHIHASSRLWYANAFPRLWYPRSSSRQWSFDNGMPLDNGMPMPPLNYGMPIPPLDHGVPMNSLNHCHPTELHHPARDFDALMDDYVFMSPHWDAKEGFFSSAPVSESSSRLSQNPDQNYY